MNVKIKKPLQTETKRKERTKQEKKGMTLNDKGIVKNFKSWRVEKEILKIQV